MRAFDICNGLAAGNIGDDLMAKAFTLHIVDHFLLDIAPIALNAFHQRGQPNVA
jgi:hypothetical protein